MSKPANPFKGIHPKDRIHNYLYEHHHCFYYSKKKELGLYRDKQSWVVSHNNLPVCYRALSFFDAIKYIIKFKKNLSIQIPTQKSTQDVSNIQSEKS